ncbi:hypothetical protein E3N88_29883 [Mikania micrantha]|uniref:Uncharacterized protein n=1 Tax=Mikania micrantha TaxID=192012 RepID=A0A5N6MK76_9ASTR|nr:hypothetical protein E3N88_29883 [Mikania micrantha]
MNRSKFLTQNALKGPAYQSWLRAAAVRTVRVRDRQGCGSVSLPGEGAVGGAGSPGIHASLVTGAFSDEDEVEISMIKEDIDEQIRGLRELRDFHLKALYLV